ncbi:MAG TPA: hypothetical protein VHP11_13150 [Tepidisphaeraceae bacterium]|nr:hypothetical protein [Tepidisphaeraceae bacterium]
MMKWLLMVAVLAALAGCSSDESSPRQRQEEALRDPWNYSPYRNDTGDVSGGGLTDFKKDAFKRDVNSVLSP